MDWLTDRARMGAVAVICFMATAIDFTSYIMSSLSDGLLMLMLIAVLRMGKKQKK